MTRVAFEGFQERSKMKRQNSDTKTFVSNLSDSALRKELAQFGFKNVPVTETTRGLLERKLLVYLQNPSKRIGTKELPKSSLSSIKCDRRGLGSSDYTDNRLLPSYSFESSNASTTENLTRSIEERLQNNRYMAHPTKFDISTENSRIANASSIHFDYSANQTNVFNRSSARIFVPPPILASDTEDDCDNANSEHVFLERTSSNPLNSEVFWKTWIISLFQLIDRWCTIFRPVEGKYSKFVSHDDLDKKRTTVSSLLVIFLLTFLSALFIIYIWKSIDSKQYIDKENAHFELCAANDRQGHSYAANSLAVTCLEPSNVESAFKTVELIYDMLGKKRQSHASCTNKLNILTMDAESESLMRKICTRGSLLACLANTRKHLDNAAYLINNNLHWRIKHIPQLKGKVDQSIQNGKILHKFLILDSQSAWCKIKTKFETFYIIVGILVIVIVMLFVAGQILIFLRNYQKQKSLAVQNMSRRILEALENRSSTKDFIELKSLQSVIPSQDRKKLLPIWNEAVKNLEEKDDRLQFSVIAKNGEEMKAVRLKDCDAACSVKLVIKNSLISKQWQSPAFNKTNKVIHPPTTCLKIRQMFDCTELNNPSLQQVIIDAILHKVGTRCKIYDIQFDEENCCVYVRCATEADAGLVHNEINGWWFDKRLVSIKFLRLERFLSRFPNSLSGPQCLLPSREASI